MFIPTYVQRNPVALLCILFYNLYSIISYPMYFIDVKFYYSRQIFYEYIVTCVFCANGDFDKKLCSKQKKGTKKTTWSFYW